MNHDHIARSRLRVDTLKWAMARTYPRVYGDRVEQHAANAKARPEISLLFSVRAAGDYSFFVDGRASVESAGGVNRLVLTPTRAVFHRHGPVPDPSSSCGVDCLPVLETPARLTITPAR